MNNNDGIDDYFNTQLIKIQISDCFWCSVAYDSKDHDTCPNCATNVNTSEITIIKEK
jgi:hypothetical protein